MSEARRYRRKGLDSTSREIVELLKRHGIEGRSVLEVGGGIGGIQLELLKAGAARATSVELTPTYEEAAGGLLREAGLEDRVQRQVSDFVLSGITVPEADVLVMNRVICCYPDMPRLAAAAADHTREILVLSFPRATWWTRLAVTVGNFVLRAARREFQVFVHPPRSIVATLEGHGLSAVLNHAGAFWTVAAFSR